MKNPKHSKTIIFNSLILIVDLANQVQGFHPEITKYAIAIVAIGNIILRFKTTQPIK